MAKAIKYGSIIFRGGKKYFVEENNPRTLRVRRVFPSHPNEDPILSPLVESLKKIKKPKVKRRKK